MASHPLSAASVPEKRAAFPTRTVLEHQLPSRRVSVLERERVKDFGKLVKLKDRKEQGLLGQMILEAARKGKRWLSEEAQQHPAWSVVKVTAAPSVVCSQGHGSYAAPPIPLPPQVTMEVPDHPISGHSGGFCYCSPFLLACESHQD